jgi:chaperonin GroES
MEAQVSELTVNIEMAPDRIMVKQHLSDNISKGGIVLPDQSSGKKLNKGTIVNIGKISPDNFEYPEMKIGNNIIFAPFGGSEIKIDEKEFLIISLQDVFGVIRE